MAIPNSAQTAEVTTTLDGKRGKFSVHAAAHEKIMGVLTNLYEDPEGAVIREYLTNALDAQVEAQAADPNYVWRPVEVTTPSHFNKTYSIRDFGTGMSVTDIENVYSQYGYSTKEHTNDQTGMLGLGSKCGLTYTGQFTVTGWKNGVRTRALITLNEDEVPEYVILDTAASKDPSGVEISVPVRDRNSFAEKTSQFLRWWKPGQVLVNGQESTPHGLTEVKPGVFLLEGTGHGYYATAPQSYIVMGNVPYAVDSEYVDSGLRDANLGFAAYVDMGAVDFPPNRERLRYNSRTKAAVKEVSQGLFEVILEEKIKEITDAPDFKAAWLAKASLERHFVNHPKVTGLAYKGHAFVDRISHPHMELSWDWQDHGQIAERGWVNIPNAMQGTLIVTGVTQGTKPTSYFKKKVKHYMETNSISGTDALLVDNDIDNKWLEWVPRIDAASIKAIKLPKDGTSAGPRVDSPYEFYTCDSSLAVTGDTAINIACPAGKTLVYISPQDMKETYRKSGCRPADLLKMLGEDYILVVLGKNRFEKFLRTHTAITAHKAIQDRINDYASKATDAEYLVGKLSYGEGEFMKVVNPDLLKDADLAALARAVQDKSFTANYTKAENLYSFARRASVHATLPDKKNIKNNPCSKYPLIDTNGGRQMKHMVIYINAVWEASNSNKP